MVCEDVVEIVAAFADESIFLTLYCCPDTVAAPGNKVVKGSAAQLTRIVALFAVIAKICC
jgi:hypothetical protein